jgi:hypothetical protein
VPSRAPKLFNGLK